MNNPDTIESLRAEPLSVNQRESFAEAALMRDIAKQREQYQIVMADKRFIPDGAELVECYRSKRGGFYIMGDPEPNDESHNCDAMGCGSLSHVIAIIPPLEEALSRTSEEGKATKTKGAA